MSRPVCRDCRHYRWRPLVPICARVPKNHHWYRTEPVSGRQVLMGNRACSAQRAWTETNAGYEYCGPDGKHWEAKSGGAE